MKASRVKGTADISPDAGWRVSGPAVFAVDPAGGHDPPLNGYTGAGNSHRIDADVWQRLNPAQGRAVRHGERRPSGFACYENYGPVLR